MTEDNARTVVLGVDPGERRYGVAIADMETRFASPLEVIDARVTDPVDRLVELADEKGAREIVVGRPIGLAGRAGPAVDAHAAFVERLRNTGLHIYEYDERFTTAIAEQGLRAAGSKRDARKALKDAVAAQVMLQGWVDSR